MCERSSVLIESDWNLKRGKLTDVWLEEATVLIESDWNLKRISVLFFPGMGRSINRIRLEFKGIRTKTAEEWVKGINRIRLEFKANQ